MLNWSFKCKFGEFDLTFQLSSMKVDSGGCLNVEENSALVLKGVSLTLHSGEVMAILGSKGSGKKALLDVIACRAENSTRGQVLLNGSTLTKSIFQQKCGYVTHSVDFINGLTVSQTLHYTPTVVSESGCWSLWEITV